MEITNLQSFDNAFSATITSSPSGAAQALTIQNPSSVKTARMLSAFIYCSVACTVTLERNGATATATALVAGIKNCNPKNPLIATSVMQAFSGSDVGNGAVMDTFTLTAGSWISIDLSIFDLPQGLADNISLRSSSITGTITLTFKWREM